MDSDIGQRAARIQPSQGGFDERQTFAEAHLPGGLTREPPPEVAAVSQRLAGADAFVVVTPECVVGLASRCELVRTFGLLALAPGRGAAPPFSV
jgi:hypothetical protein